MEKTLRERAIDIANSGYTTELLKDKTTDGESIYLAVNPELDGCMAQGETAEDALASLDEVRIDYIEHLLEFNLTVPSPQVTRTKDIAGSNVIQRDIEGLRFPEFEIYMDAVIQPDEREKLFSTSLST